MRLPHCEVAVIASHRESHIAGMQLRESVCAWGGGAETHTANVTMTPTFIFPDPVVFGAPSRAWALSLPLFCAFACSIRTGLSSASEELFFSAPANTDDLCALGIALDVYAGV